MSDRADDLRASIWIISEVARVKGTHGEEFGLVLHAARERLEQIDAEEAEDAEVQDLR